MSDIEKAEELLKKFMRYVSPDRFPAPAERQSLYEEAQEYFNKPVVIKDWMKRDVEISVDADGDVCFETLMAIDIPNSYFKKEELVRGLREIGVIE